MAFRIETQSLNISYNKSSLDVSAKKGRLEAKIQELKLKAQTSKNASSSNNSILPKQIAMQPPARSTLEAKRSRLETVVKRVKQTVHDSLTARTQPSATAGKRSRQEKSSTTKSSASHKRQKINNEIGESSRSFSSPARETYESDALPGESRLQRACRKELSKRLAAEGKQLGIVAKNEKDFFLESFAISLNSLARAGLLKDRVHPEDTFTVEDLKDLLRDYYKESATSSGKEKESFRPEIEGKILAKIFRVHLVIYEVGAYDEEKAIEGNGDFWDQQVEYGSSSYPELTIGLYDRCYAPVMKAEKAAEQKQPSIKELRSQISEKEPSGKIFSHKIWKKKYEKALIGEVVRQQKENPHCQIDWIKAAKVVNRVSRGKRIFTPKQCEGKVAMRRRHYKKKPRLDWRKSDTKALVAIVQPQIPNIDWAYTAKKVKKATGIPFSPDQCRKRWGHANPELNHGSWSDAERILLIFGRNKGMTHMEISQILLKGTRSPEQCNTKWQRIRRMSGARSWAKRDDQKLLESYEIYKQFKNKWIRISKESFKGKYNNVQCCMRWLALNEESRFVFLNNSIETEADLSEEQQLPLWSDWDDELLVISVVSNGFDWKYISEKIFNGNRSAEECAKRYRDLEGSPAFERIKVQAVQAGEEFQLRMDAYDHASDSSDLESSTSDYSSESSESSEDSDTESSS